MNNTTLRSGNPLKLRKNLLYYKMTFSEKIKTMNNKIEQSKVQYDLDIQTANIAAFSSGNISKHEFLTHKDVLPEKHLLEKAGTIIRFEYSPLGSESK